MRAFLYNRVSKVNKQSKLIVKEKLNEEPKYEDSNHHRPSNGRFVWYC